MSLAFRNTISILSMTKGCALTIEQYYCEGGGHVPKQIGKLIDRLKGSCDEALGLWQGKITQKQCDAIGVRYSAIERGLKGRHSDKRNAYINLCLGLLNDLWEQLKDPVKRAAINTVITDTERLYQYYDRDLSKHECMEAASVAAKYWYELIA